MFRVINKKLPSVPQVPQEQVKPPELKSTCFLPKIDFLEWRSKNEVKYTIEDSTKVLVHAKRPTDCTPELGEYDKTSGYFLVWED